MRIAKYIDPAVFYDKTAARPYVMSPYLACVNTLSAWPAPHRARDALLALENGNAVGDSDDEGEQDDVPREEALHSKKETHGKAIRYWSFHGFREDEHSNTLQRAYTRDEDHPQTSIIEENNREGSIRTQSTRYDEDKVVTSENPSHRAALRRLGSYDRVSDARRTSVIGQAATMTPFHEEDSDDMEDDNASFHTAVEYIIEDEVQPDGTVVPVKKKKGLSVKKVRKSLHIPSAKTVQKNMRGLSIKRKDRGAKSTDTLDKEATPRNSSEGAPRKSLDLMKPFRFGNHDKESTVSRKSMQSDRPSDKASTATISSKHSTATLQSAGLPAISTGPTGQPQNNDSHLFSPTESIAPQPASASQMTSPISPTTLRSESAATITSSEAQPAALESVRSMEASPTTAPPQAAQSLHSAVDDNKHEPAPDDGLSHRLDDRLGPWRFDDPKIEPIEDTAFIFGDTNHTVKDRRKYFAKNAENREQFEFDPDIVYCMSFFLPYMNFNTFDLKLGPLGANLHKYVNDQPLRYMARSSERPDEIFFTIEFSLE